MSSRKVIFGKINNEFLAIGSPAITQTIATCELRIEALKLDKSALAIEDWLALPILEMVNNGATIYGDPALLCGLLYGAWNVNPTMQPIIFNLMNTNCEYIVLDKSLSLFFEGYRHSTSGLLPVQKYYGNESNKFTALNIWNTSFSHYCIHRISDATFPTMPMNPFSFLGVPSLKKSSREKIRSVNSLILDTQRFSQIIPKIIVDDKVDCALKYLTFCDDPNEMREPFIYLLEGYFKGKLCFDINIPSEVEQKLRSHPYELSRAVTEYVVSIIQSY